MQIAAVPTAPALEAANAPGNYTIQKSLAQHLNAAPRAHNKLGRAAVIVIIVPTATKRERKSQRRAAECARKYIINMHFHKTGAVCICECGHNYFEMRFPRNEEINGRVALRSSVQCVELLIFEELQQQNTRCKRRCIFYSAAVFITFFLRAGWRARGNNIKETIQLENYTHYESILRGAERKDE
jgi:hypothetical protein